MNEIINEGLEPSPDLFAFVCSEHVELKEISYIDYDDERYAIRETNGKYGYSINKNNFSQQLKKKIVTFSDEVDYNLDIIIHRDSTLITLQEFESKIKYFESSDELSAIIRCGEWFVKAIVEKSIITS